MEVDQGQLNVLATECLECDVAGAVAIGDDVAGRIGDGETLVDVTLFH